MINKFVTGLKIVFAQAQPPSHFERWWRETCPELSRAEARWKYELFCQQHNLDPQTGESV